MTAKITAIITDASRMVGEGVLFDVSWLYLVARPLFPGYFITLKELGPAMVTSVVHGYEKQVLEAKDIVELEKKKAEENDTVM